MKTTRVRQDIAYRGYSVLPHFLMLLVKEKRINMTSIGWFSAFIGLANFDPRNQHSYGCITKSPSAIGKFLNKDSTSVSRQLELLLKAGLLDFYSPNSKQTPLRVKHYWIFDYRMITKLVKINFQSYEEVEKILNAVGPIKTQDDLVNLPDKLASLLSKTANFQPVQTQKQPQIYKSLSKSEFNGLRKGSMEKNKGVVKNIGEKEKYIEIKKNYDLDLNCPICDPSIKTGGEVCKKCRQDIHGALDLATPIQKR